MNTLESSPVSTPPLGAGARPDPLPLRIVRAAALLGLALLLSLVLSLALFSSSAFFTAAVRPLFSWDAQEGRAAGVLTLGALALLPVVLFVLAWRFRLRSWWWIGGGYLGLAPVLVYLAIDDPVVLHPTTIDEIAPAFPGAEKSYALLMQYSKQTPSGEAKAFAEWKPRVSGMPVGPEPENKWFDFLRKNRPALEADWRDLEPQRRWLNELNAFERIGDLAEASFESNIPTFAVWRLLAQRSVHIGGLQLADGHPDEAIETMLPILQASRKLQPSARSLVRFMIGIANERLVVLYATHIVKTATVSAATKAKLAAVLAGGVRGEAGARRVVSIERAFYVSRVFEKPAGDLFTLSSVNDRTPPIRPLLNAISPLIYNPRRTMNMMAELNSELQEFAARRELKSSRAAESYEQKLKPKFKNFGGALLADQAQPAYAKILVGYWALHDARDELTTLLGTAR
jgi:hypothetical protein